MQTVTISQKFQIVIPREMRNALRLQPGQEIQAIQYENRIELIPIEAIAAACGFLKGINAAIRREPDRA